MKQPVSYLQTDPRWGGQDYSAAGERTTIGASGCGPTAMAMVLATWVDPSITPATECAWALAKGYKAPHQGTYYGYFAKAAARFGLRCTQCNWNSLYGNSQSSVHAQAKAALDAGGLVIACMGKGNWTSSGHYVLLWDMVGDTVYINDPASTLPRRTRGSYALFRQQVKYYWVIEAPEREEDMDMRIDEWIQSMSGEQAYQLMEKASHYAGTIQEPAWSQGEGHWAQAAAAGVVDGTGPERYVKRDELVAVLGRRGLL